MTVVEDRPSRATPLTDAQRALVEANVRLVPFFVSRWYSRASEDDKAEHVANGMLGLIRAAQLFDADRGFRFSTYAQHWIRQSIGRGFATGEGIGYRQTVGYSDAGGRKPDATWVPPASLDAHAVRGDEPWSLSETLAADVDVAEDAVARVMAGEAQVAVIASCRDAVDVDIAVALINDTGETLEVLADRAGVSREAIRQRRRALIARVNHPTGAASSRRTR